MKLLVISWQLLRYRVAVMLALFMLLGAALHGELVSVPAWRLIVATLALALSYISATSSNDLADYEIDKINHPKSPGRPLSSGSATRSDVWMVFGVASAASAAIASTLGTQALLVMAAAIAINVAYSLPPLRISYRTFLAPLLLGFGYVCIPYMLGVAAMQDSLGAADLGWMAGLYILFVGRIMLKDFRDRAGDAKYGKPTFLLRFGKTDTCILSGVLVACGGILLAYMSRGFAWFFAIIAVYIIAILSMLIRLHRAKPGKDEQLSIGVGAKMGNGLLITLLAAIMLKVASVDTAIQITAILLVAALFFLNFVAFLQYPERATIGYKG